MTTFIEQIQSFLKDPSITDICINGPGVFFVDRGRGLEPEGTIESNAEIHTWVLDTLAQAGLGWDARCPFVDASLSTGHRLHAAFPPVARQGLTVSLRSLPRTIGESALLAQKHGLSRWGASPHYRRLIDAVTRGESVIISGATGSGKTTLANDLLAWIPSSERIIALEDTTELAPVHPHFVSLLSRHPNADGFGEVTLRTLLKQTLRMRPDRVILGECRGAEVLDLLQALNTGHHGAMATLHANSPRDALRRIELLCALHSQSGGSLAPSTIRELIAVGIRWIAQTHRTGQTRALTELWRIEGREGDTILLRPMIESETYECSPRLAVG